MILLRLLARLIFLLAFLLLGFGAWIWLTEPNVTRAAGEIWYAFHLESLNLSQVIIQRYLHPELWDQLVLPMLLRPFWEAVLLVFIGGFVLAGILGFIGRKGRGGAED
jgi:hypothetical protein